MPVQDWLTAGLPAMGTMCFNVICFNFYIGKRAIDYIRKSKSSSRDEPKTIRQKRSTACIC